MSFFSLRFEDADSVAAWQPINDGVMGGVSRSQFCFDAAGHAVFKGVVSLENQGGFASVRAPCPLPVPAEAKGFVLTVRGDGKRYKFNVRTDAGFDGINYQAEIQPVAGQWAEIRLPCAAFRATFRGRLLPDAPPLQPARIRQLGWVIGDRQAGPFCFHVVAVETF